MSECSKSSCAASLNFNKDELLSDVDSEQAEDEDSDWGNETMNGMSEYVLAIRSRRNEDVGTVI